MIMGSSQSYPGLTEDLLEDYSTLTYLSKGEILYLMKKFHSIDPEKITADIHHRFNRDEINEKFHVLKYNPFQDRLYCVFSSKQDGCFSFEDMVDLCSAMSPECPPDVKAAWAFRVYDMNDDNQISADDIAETLERLTGAAAGMGSRHDQLDKESKMKVAKTILQEMKLDNSGSFGVTEFRILMSRIPEFPSSFYFKL